MPELWFTFSSTSSRYSITNKEQVSCVDVDINIGVFHALGVILDAFSTRLGGLDTSCINLCSNDGVLLMNNASLSEEQILKSVDFPLVLVVSVPVTGIKFFCSFIVHLICFILSGKWNSMSYYLFTIYYCLFQELFWI